VRGVHLRRQRAMRLGDRVPGFLRGQSLGPELFLSGRGQHPTDVHVGEPVPVQRPQPVHMRPRTARLHVLQSGRRDFSHLRTTARRADTNPGADARRAVRHVPQPRRRVSRGLVRWARRCRPRHVPVYRRDRRRS